MPSQQRKTHRLGVVLVRAQEVHGEFGLAGAHDAAPQVPGCDDLTNWRRLELAIVLEDGAREGDFDDRTRDLHAILQNRIPPISDTIDSLKGQPLLSYFYQIDVFVKGLGH